MALEHAEIGAGLVSEYLELTGDNDEDELAAATDAVCSILHLLGPRGPVALRNATHHMAAEMPSVW